MKKLAALLLAGGAMCVSGGCASPAYSGGENVQRVANTWRYDALELNDDWDHFLLLRPASQMTNWNARVGAD